MRLLIAAANPKKDLNVSAEIESIEAQVRKLGEERMQFRALPDATRNGLSDIIADYEPHILHYVGHSDFKGSDGKKGEGYVYLHDERDPAKVDPVSSADLKTMMQHSRPCLVVLNSCESGATSGDAPKAGLAQCLVSRLNIPFVVAMQNPVSDEAAIAFSNRLYSSIARGDTVATAVTKGRSKISEQRNELTKIELISHRRFTHRTIPSWTRLWLHHWRQVRPQNLPRKMERQNSPQPKRKRKSGPRSQQLSSQLRRSWAELKPS